MAKESRVDTLDGLRGFATLVVVLYHWGYVCNLGGRDGAIHWLGKLFTVGWVGVDIFFVLSGYLITGILLRTHGQPFATRRFYVRRVARVVPLYFAFLLLYVYVVPQLTADSLRNLGDISQGLADARERSIWLFTYTANLQMVLYNDFFGAGLVPIWSLCVEVHFYLLWPILLRIVRPRAVATVCIALLAFGVILRLVLFHAGVSYRGIYFFTGTRLDALLVGSLIAATKAHHPHVWPRLGRFQRGLLTTASLVVFALWTLERGTLSESSYLTVYFGYVAIAAAAGIVLVSCLLPTKPTPLVRFLSLSPLRLLGKYSYATYLFHLPAFTLTAELAKQANLSFIPAAMTVFGAGSICTGLLAFASWNMLEQRCLAVAHGWFRTPEKATASCNGVDGPELVGATEPTRPHTGERAFPRDRP